MRGSRSRGAGRRQRQETIAALQILVAWERALPLPNLHELLESGNRDVRLEALRLAPLVPLTPENRSSLLRTLREGNEDENTIAALTAGRLRLQEALPSLARCLRTGTAELAPTRLRRWRRCRPRAGKPCNKSPAATIPPLSLPRRPWNAAGERRGSDGRWWFPSRYKRSPVCLFALGIATFVSLVKGCFVLRRMARAGRQDHSAAPPQIAPGAARLHHCGSSRRLARIAAVRAPPAGTPFRPERSGHRAGRARRRANWRSGARNSACAHRRASSPGNLPTAPVRGVYESRDPIRVVVIDKEKGGPVDAWNAAINASTSPVIGLLDPAKRVPAGRSFAPDSADAGFGG